MDKVLKRENAQRTPAYRKDKAEEGFLESLNAVLEPHEKALDAPPGTNPSHVFIFGLPRTGTTLLFQLLCHCLEFGYVNNIIARFWKAHLHGIHLSRALTGTDRTTSYRSTHGVTPLLTDPHEFGYFWSEWLGQGEHIKRTEEVNWQGLGSALRRIGKAFGMPVLHKNLIVGMHLEGIAKTVERCAFIWVKREPIENGLSILKTREARYGDRNQWWSLRPPEWKDLLKSPWSVQIARQISRLNAHFSEQISNAGIEPVVVHYEDVIGSPGRIVEDVRQRLSRQSIELVKIHEPPAQFERPTFYVSSEDREELRKALVP